MRWTGPALALAAWLVALPAAAEAVREHVRGAIVGLAGDRLRIAPARGADLVVELEPEATVMAVARMPLSGVYKGDYVGAATVPGSDGHRLALGVVVFPESLRGAGEGERPWDMAPDATMTNATVAMTVRLHDGKILLLSWQGREAEVDVPASVPVVRFEPGDRGLLRSGAAVFINATRHPDGRLTATRVNVGREGVVPPL